MFLQSGFETASLANLHQGVRRSTQYIPSGYEMRVWGCCIVARSVFSWCFSESLRLVSCQGPCASVASRHELNHERAWQSPRGEASLLQESNTLCLGFALDLPGLQELPKRPTGQMPRMECRRPLRCPVRWQRAVFIAFVCVLPHTQSLSPFCNHFGPGQGLALPRPDLAHWFECLLCFF